MISEINVYFRISEIATLDIHINFFWISQIQRLFGIISDIRNNYFGYPNINIYFRYPKYLFRISKIIIPDIRNYAKTAFYLRYPKKVILDIQNNNFGYPKINIYFGYQKLLFWISEIVISDIWNSFLDI